MTKSLRRSKRNGRKGGGGEEDGNKKIVDDTLEKLRQLNVYVFLNPNDKEKFVRGLYRIANNGGRNDETDESVNYAKTIAEKNGYDVLHIATLLSGGLQGGGRRRTRRRRTRRRRCRTKRR